MESPLVSDHVHRSAFNLTVCEKCFRCLVLFHVAGVWSHPDEFPLLPEDEESAGDMNMVGPGKPPGIDYVDGDMNMFGPERPSELGSTDEEPNLLGPQESSQFGNSAEQFGQAITPFQGDGMPANGQISLIGNTRRNESQR